MYAAASAHAIITEFCNCVRHVDSCVEDMTESAVRSKTHQHSDEENVGEEKGAKTVEESVDAPLPLGLAVKEQQVVLPATGRELCLSLDTRNPVCVAWISVD